MELLDFQWWQQLSVDETDIQRLFSCKLSRAPRSSRCLTGFTFHPLGGWFTLNVVCIKQKARMSSLCGISSRLNYIASRQES